MKNLVFILLVLVSISTAFAQKKCTKEVALTKELLGSDRRNLVSQNIHLNVLQLRKFWPNYDWYETEREGIVEKKLTLIEKYLDDTNQISDIELDLIHTQSTSLDKKLGDVRDKMYEKLKSDLGAEVAMRFLQIDTQISNLLAIQLLDKKPLVGVLTKEEREQVEAEKRKDLNQ